ncbi:MAG: aconitate hydratase AcnA [Gemmatimonadota bacterium]|jgi:aconitate hydratase|nr:aconitate hydratase AcnA [Gemmatimonadota bacterium]
MTRDSFGARSTLRVGDREYEIYRLSALQREGIDVSRLPYSLRILLENLLRYEDGVSVAREDILALARWNPAAAVDREIAFTPARVILQDFTGVPAIVDLAAMRDAMSALGGDPKKINPLQPVELVIDHSVQVDASASADAFRINEELDYSRNGERYSFLKWGQQAFSNFKVLPPNTGIVHQVNLEYLARVVFSSDELRNEDGKPVAYPDTVVGTDSHTPMVNGLGVLGWGVGGIEAEAGMLGQPISMLIPQVIGFRLEGNLPEGTTATDLVLTVTEMLRKKGVVGKFVEFYGPGISNLPLADRATIGNMSPEYGATCAIFPVDEITLDYMRLTGRSEERVALVEAYMKEQGLFHTSESPTPLFTDTLTLDLSTVEPSIAGPRRPQDRIRLAKSKEAFAEVLPSLLPAGGASEKPASASGHDLDNGSVVIAAITSCTNTSNPSVMMAAGLVAKRAVERGLSRQPWVKTSLAPGSKVVTAYYDKAGLTPYLDQLGFNVVGYGCTTCIGNSGPLPDEISTEITEGNLVVASVLSGNRNFEGRINSEVRANYLMSPPLVVAFAIVGRMDWDPYSEPLGTGKDGEPVFLKDIWPTRAEIDAAMRAGIQSGMYAGSYGAAFSGDERWLSLPAPGGDRFEWVDDSTYIRRPTYFDDMPRHAREKVREISDARVIAVLGDSVTTDHISPAGSIRKDSPAGRYLLEHGVSQVDFNSYGSRRGNHEAMVRGTFANTRIRNRLVPGVEGGFTKHFPTDEITTIYDAAMRYADEGTPLVILAGKEYGSGSSRDWAAKGPYLQGISAVIAESYERIHRSNLIGMGILPLQFLAGESVDSLGLTGEEVINIDGLENAFATGFSNGREITVTAKRAGAEPVVFRATIRIDTPQEALYYRHGGILQYVLRQLLGDSEAPASIVENMEAPIDATNGRATENSIQSFPASDAPGY